MPEWWASRCRRWSRNPTPVATSASPPPSISISTLTEVSAVSRSALPLRAIFPVSAKHSADVYPAGLDTLGVVLETFEAGEAFDVRAEGRRAPRR